MHPNNFKSKIGNKIFKFKKNFEVFSKINKNITFFTNAKKNPINQLLNYGFEIEENLLDDKQINYILKKYLILNNLDDDKTYYQNLTFPFFDKSIIEKVLKSKIFEQTKVFFKSIYKLEPVFQQSPLLIITKPGFNKNEMKKNYKIPADFHTDYPTEMALHIPLNDLKEGAIHTVYCKSSNRNIFVKSTSKYKEEFAHRFEKINLVTKKGAGILLDTQGIHKANVNKRDIRIMLFFKFSSKKNIIKNIDYTDASIKAKNSNYFNFEKNNLIKDKKNSLIFGLEESQTKIFDYFLL